MLVHAEDLDVVEPVGILQEKPVSLGQDRAVGGVPRHRESLSDPSDREVLDHQGLQRPAQRPTGELRPRLGGLAGVLAPHVPAVSAPVAADPYQQRRRPPPQGLVREPPGHRVSCGALAAASPAPLVRLLDPAGQDRSLWLEALPDDFEAEVVQAAERGQVRAGEGSVKHVEVFRMGSVRTPIIGRPRPLSSERRAAPCYTLNCAEPLYVMSKPTETERGDVPLSGGCSPHRVGQR